MNVCFFDHHDTPYPITTYGGIERINQLLFQVFSNNKVCSTLICTDKSTIESQNDHQTIIKLPYKEIENIRYGKTEIAKYFNGDIFQTHTSSSYHSNFNTNNFTGKIVSTCHGYQEWAGNKYQIFVSTNQYEQHKQDNLITSQVKYVFIVPGCIDSSKLHYDSKGSHDKLVWLGRICSAKGIDRLIQIAEKINEKILVAGVNHDEHLYQQLKQIKNIDLVGPLSEKDKISFFAQAKANLHTSTFEDPFPLTIIEAQMCGIPTITWANGSMKESNFSQENVFNSLNDIVTCLNKQTFKKHSCAEIAQWTKEKFSELALFKKYKKVYDWVITNN